MKHMLSAITAVLLLATSAFGQIAVVENPTSQSSFVEASVKLAVGDAVSWDVTPEPTKMVENNGTLYFNGPAGTYKVTALVQSIVDNKITNKKTKVTVVIGQPTPTPIPPIPVPDPTDTFTLAIQAAYTAETAADKATNTQKLASIYRMSAKNMVNDPTITTTASLFAIMKTASEATLPTTVIPGVRKVVGTRLNPLFSNSATLDASLRAKLTTELNAIADALSAAK